MSIRDQIIDAHQRGEIDLTVSRQLEIAEIFDCAESTVNRARKSLGVGRPAKWQLLLEAHKRGEVDLENWPQRKIADVFGCGEDTVRNAAKNGGIKRKERRGAKPVDPMQKKDNAAARAYWYKYRPVCRLLNKWGVIPERAGKSPREWRAYVSEL